MARFFTALKRGFQAASEGSPSMAEHRSQKAQLGCGTLILIALIVALFSGQSEVSDLQEEIGNLQTQVERLEGKIDSLSAAVAELVAQ